MELLNELNRCRLCLSGGGNFIRIFNVNVKTSFIVADLISDLLRFEVSREDGYPQVVCLTCFRKLREFQIYKEQCKTCITSYYNKYFKPNGDVAVNGALSMERVLEEECFEDGSNTRSEVNHRPINVKEELGIFDISVNQHIPVNEEFSKEEEESFDDGSDTRSEICISPMKLELNEENVCPNAEEGPTDDRVSEHIQGGSETLNELERGLEEDLVESEPQEMFSEETCEVTVETIVENPSSDEMPVPSSRSLRKRKRDTRSNIGEQQQKTQREAEELREKDKDTSQKNECVAVSVERSTERDVEEECLQDGSDTSSENCMSPLKLESDEEYIDPNDEVPAVTLQTSHVSETDGRTSSSKETFSISILCRNNSPANVFAQALNVTVPTREDNASSSELPVRSLRSITRKKRERQLNVGEQQRNMERKAEEDKEEERICQVYKCHHCGKEFSQKSNLYTHVKIHGTEKPFLCSTCGKRFTLKKYLVQHQSVHKKDKDFICKVCRKKFIWRNSLINHMTTQHRHRIMYQCTQCDESFDKKFKLKNHQPAHDGKRVCDYEKCNKVFEKFKDWLLHRKSHLENKTLVCDICGQKCAFKSHLRKHVMRHIGMKPHECNVCRKRFLDSSNLSRHMIVHTDERLFSCDVCGKNFKLKNNLVVHNRIHTGECPYSCKLCKNAFKTNNELDRHMSFHSKDNLFSCDVCLKRFSCKAYLYKHQKTHSKHAKCV